MTERRRLSTIMSKRHPQWELFTMLIDMRLDYKENKKGKATWNCDGTLIGAKEILKLMSMDIHKSIKYLESNGGFCDCEILLNVNED